MNKLDDAFKDANRASGSPTECKVLPFGLAPLQQIDPKLLVTGDDELDGFVLSLALAYNDIKTIHWIIHILSNDVPEDLGTISADAGQWMGMRVQTTRWLMALAHEIILAIARAKEQGVLDRAAVRKVVKSLPPPHQRLWKELVAVSTKSFGRGMTVRPYLRDLRNYAAFHYKFPARLLDAYRAHFLTDARSNYNEWAYVSVGATLKRSRFYFADAAAQRMVTGDEELQKKFEQSHEFLQELHHTLIGFVWGYLRRVSR